MTAATISGRAVHIYADGRPISAPYRHARSGLRRSRCIDADARRPVPVVIDAARPGTRADCEHGQRPCLWVGCRYHLYLDVNPETGSIKLNFPGLEVWELRETCALDVADRCGLTLEEVGALLNLTRERIRQVELDATAKAAAGVENGKGVPATGIRS